jgi:hypothetical protein
MGFGNKILSTNRVTCCANLETESAGSGESRVGGLQIAQFNPRKMHSARFLAASEFAEFFYHTRDESLAKHSEIRNDLR